VGSDTLRQRHRPVSFVLHENSAAIDAGDRLAGINDGFSGGVYFIRLATSESSLARRMLLLR
jgi:hypothetical protein